MTIQWTPIRLILFILCYRQRNRCVWVCVCFPSSHSLCLYSVEISLRFAHVWTCLWYKSIENHIHFHSIQFFDSFISDLFVSYFITCFCVGCTLVSRQIPWKFSALPHSPQLRSSKKRKYLKRRCNCWYLSVWYVFLSAKNFEYAERVCCVLKYFYSGFISIINQERIFDGNSGFKS